jgi:type I restriction enzyme S subunit
MGMSELPNNWAWSTVGALADYIQRGKSPKYAETSELPVINQKCIRWNELQLQHLKYVHPDQVSAWDESRYIRSGDILWNSTGTGTVGRAHLVKEADCVPAKVVDSHVTIVRATPGLEPRYLFNWIKSPAVQNKIEEMCDGTTNQIELSRTAIAATAIPVAPREEQTRIADQLDTLLARIKACNDHLDAIPGLLKRFRQAAVSAAMAGELTAEWSGSTPAQAWSIDELQALCEPKRVITYGVVKLGEETPAGTPCLRTSNVRWLKFELDGMKRIASDLSAQYGRTVLNGGEILVNVRGTLGGVAVATPKMHGWNVSREVAVVPVDADLINPEFTAYWVASLESQRWLARMEKGVAYVGINIEDLRRLPVRYPSLDEQNEIVRRLSNLLLVADQIERLLAKVSERSILLVPQVLAKAFRGELVPQDAKDEPASQLLQRIAAEQAEVPKTAPSGKKRGRKAAEMPAAQPARQTGMPAWIDLPADAWSDHGAVHDEHLVTVLLTAVLKAWGQPMPQEQARLAALLCLQPRLFTAALPAEHAKQWRRLVGQAAEPLPAQVASLQPALNTPWRRALAGMRGRGDLLESGQGTLAAWSLGPQASHVDTSGWPDGRAAFTLAYLQTQGVDVVLPTLSMEAQEFVHARAA